jgi:hypothetical protein
MLRLRTTSTWFALLLAPVFANGQSDAGLWRFVHPNAQAVISIDWQRVKQSPAGAMIREKWVNAGALPIPPVPGIEFLDDVDRILISSPGQNAGEPAPEPDSDAAPTFVPDAPVLIVVHGHFDLAKVRQVLVQHGAKAQTFNSIQVYRPQGKNAKDLAFVPLDAQTVLIGDPSSIFASLERNKFAPPPLAAGSILARVAEMDANYEVWVLMSTPDVLGSDRLTAMFSGGEWGSDARGFEAGLSFRNGLAADVVVRFATEAAAKKLASEMARLMKMAVKDKTGEPVMQELGKKLKFAVEGPAARISLRLTAQELEKNAQVFASARKAPALAPTAAPVAEIRPVVTPLPAAPSKASVIRIEGLDEGTREVPYRER